MTRNLNLNALRVFAMAARHGSFQRAAEVLNISHGAVSQRIKQLELDLGVVLFDRKPRGVSLTRKGQRYCASVEEALAILTKATADLERSNSRITLHLGSSFISKWLMPKMATFNTRYPNVTLATEVHDEVLRRNLGRSELGVWPAREAVSNPAHHIRCLCELRLVAVCSPNFLRPDWPVDTETLLTFPLLQDANRRWERLIESTGHRGTPRLLDFDRSALALDAAIQGHGVAIAPTYMIDSDVRAHRLVEIWHSPEPSGEYLFLAWAREAGRDRPLKQTVGWILSEFGIEGAAPV